MEATASNSSSTRMAPCPKSRRGSVRYCAVSRVTPDKFLEVIGIVDPALQDAMIAFLPEVTTTDDQADRVGAYLLDRLEEDSAFCASVIETTPSLCISGDVRDRVCLKVLDHLRAVEASEVGKVARFVLENASAATAAEVVGSLREGLSLVDARDPRRRIPDRTGKGPTAAAGV